MIVHASANAGAAAGAGGISYWVFWIMLAIIVFLAAVILIRDQGVRSAIRRIFLRVRKEIHTARIKAAISKEKEKLAQLWEKLGKKLWAGGLHMEGEGESEDLQEIREELERLENEETGLDREIEAVQAEIEKDDNVFDRFKQEQEAAINRQEEQKIPELEELGRLKKELNNIEKAAQEKLKLKSRSQKKLAARKRKIEEIRLDNGLSKIEQKMKTEALQEEIEALDREIRKMNEELAPLYEKKGNPGKAIAELEPKIAGYDEKIRSLKEELTARHKEYDQKNREQLKRKGNLAGKKNQVNRRKNILYRRLGKLVYPRGRGVEDEELQPLYTGIDRVERTIRDLEKQLR